MYAYPWLQDWSWYLENTKQKKTKLKYYIIPPKQNELNLDAILTKISKNECEVKHRVICLVWIVFVHIKQYITLFVYFQEYNYRIRDVWTFTQCNEWGVMGSWITTIMITIIILHSVVNPLLITSDTLALWPCSCFCMITLKAAAKSSQLKSIL